MSTQAEMTPRAAWMLILAAAAILMVTMGARLVTGLFMALINLPIREADVVRAPDAVVA